MNIDQRLAEKAGKLIHKGQSLRSFFEEGHISGPASHDRQSFIEWRSQSLAFLTSSLGVEHTYSKQFDRDVVYETVFSSQAGIGILNAVKQDIEDGSFANIKALISGEIFSDFLEMSQHLLSSNYYIPAASLIGAVLEDSLRTIAKNHEKITVNHGDDLGTLNGKCVGVNIYNSIMAKRISTWTDIRNSADHGNFEKVKIGDVQEMYDGVSKFLAENLK